MINILRARFQQKYRTIPYPKEAPTLPDRFQGLPVIGQMNCSNGCHQCMDACPTDAIALDAHGIKIDLGRCIFCGVCVKVCKQGKIRFSQDYRLATRTRQDLICKGRNYALAHQLIEKTRRLFGRSLKLRQVSAGGCNACEADTNVLNTVVFDLGRFGIQFVASPRHADGLLITGPVTQNMKLALQKTYDAVSSPKIVIAVGSCAISGGPYLNHEQVCNGADKMIPIDLYIPGCPPHPMTILDGLLRLLGRLEEKGSLSPFKSLSST